VGNLTVGGDLKLSGEGTLVVTGTGSIELGSSGIPAAPGTFQVDSGATLAGAGTIGAVFVDNGTIDASAGLLTLNGNVTGSGMMFIGPHSALSVAGTIDSAGIVFRAGGDERLELGSPYHVLSAISGFGANDLIDLVGIGAANSASFAAGVLQVNTAGGPLSLNFAGSYAQQNFTLASDHHGGTAIGWHA
jgi:hypothetical protein